MGKQCGGKGLSFVLLGWLLAGESDKHKERVFGVFNSYSALTWAVNETSAAIAASLEEPMSPGADTIGTTHRTLLLKELERARRSSQGSNPFPGGSPQT